MSNSGIPVDSSTLEGWVQNYKKNKDLLFITDSALISLSQLENFIREAKQKYSSPEFNAIKIYFIRYVIKKSTDDILKEVDKDISQPSLVFVPVKNADPVTWTGEDFKLEDGKIFLLPFCNPQNPPDNTGLCRPKCGDGKSAGDGSST